MNRGTPGLPVHHQLPESTQSHVHWVGDTIQPSHPLSSPSSPAPNPSQHQGLFKCIRWPKNWSFSFSISPSNEHSGLSYLLSVIYWCATNHPKCRDSNQSLFLCRWFCSLGWAHLSSYSAGQGITHDAAVIWQFDWLLAGCLGSPLCGFSSTIRLNQASGQGSLRSSSKQVKAEGARLPEALLGPFTIPLLAHSIDQSKYRTRPDLRSGKVDLIFSQE